MGWQLRQVASVKLSSDSTVSALQAELAQLQSDTESLQAEAVAALLPGSEVHLGGEVFSYDGERGRNEAALPMAAPQGAWIISMALAAITT